jgi:riboflavin kinase / FMN adenylyltransferase
MITVHPPETAPAAQNGWFAAIGMFDGVHLGHQRVVGEARRAAAAAGGRTAVVTFDPHPLAVVRPAQAPRLIEPISRRLRRLGECGADAAVVIPFDVARAGQSPAEFVAWLAAALPGLRALFVGEGFRFGRDRAGDIASLQALGAVHGFNVHALPPVQLDGEVVSSSAVRRLVQAGALDRAAGLLGRRPSLTGRVVRGDGMARQLGFPTANLDVRGLELPPNGVYAGRTSAGGRTCKAAVNIGIRPTLAAGRLPVQVEAHILDFDGGLYGSELEVVLTTRLRDERRFENVEALKRQIAADVAVVRASAD